MAETLRVNLEVKSKGVEVLDKTGKRMDKVAASSKRLKIALAATAAVGAVALVKGMRGALSVSKEWLAASAKQEAAVSRLDAALRSAGTFTPELSAKYQELASSFQRVSTAGDEELLPLMGKLTSIGGVQADQMEEATRAALDLSAGLGVDLNSAFLLVSKAAAGNTETLGRYGIAVEKGESNSETFANVLEKVNQQFGGQAEAQINTYSGAVKQLSNTWGDTQEQLGDTIRVVLMPIVKQMDLAAKAVGDWVAAHKTESIRMFGRVVLIVGEAIGGAASAAATAVEAYGELRAMFARLLAGALRPLIDGLGWLIGAIAKMGKFVGVNVSVLEDFEQTLADLSGGLDANVEDQERFAARIGEGTSKVRALAAALNEKLTAAVGSATVAMGENAKATAKATVAQEEQNETIKEATKLEKEYEQAQANRLALGEQRAERAAEKMAMLADWTGRFRSELEGIKNATSSVGIGGGVTQDFDTSSPAVAKLIERIERVAVDGFGKFRTAATSVLKQIQEGDVLGLKQIAKALHQDFEFFRDTPRSGRAAGAAAGLAQLVSEILNTLPKRAEGGPVMASHPVVVGERGPEVFVPRTSGAIMPSGATLGDPQIIRLLQQIAQRVGTPPIMGREAVQAVAESTARLQSRNAIRVRS